VHEGGGENCNALGKNHGKGRTALPAVKRRGGRNFISIRSKEEEGIAISISGGKMRGKVESAGLQERNNVSKSEGRKGKLCNREEQGDEKKKRKAPDTSCEKPYPKKEIV